MNFVAKSTPFEKVSCDCIIVGVHTHQQLSKNAAIFEQHSSISLTSLFNRHELSGKSGQIITLHQPTPLIKKALIVGFGAQQDNTPENFRKVVQTIANTVIKQAITKPYFMIDDIDVDGWSTQDKAHCVAEKMQYANYRFTRCKSDKPKKLPKYAITYQSSQVAHAKAGFIVGSAVGMGMNVARELGDLPGNICTPRYLANEARKLAKAHSTVTTKILSEKQMAALGMGSLLSVSAGSVEPAQFIIMEYQGLKKGTAKDKKPHMLVGKGITFDTGGISLKPGAAMDEMKYDMCGAASVFGTMNALATLAPKINVVAIVAAAENMPNGNATKPGDIVTSMSGTTIEVLNTDAEGRLVLCDALSYAARYQPQSVVDIATLTGACVIALGSHATGLFSNNDDLADALLQSGKRTGDRAWPMPIWDDYKKQLHSNFADLANIGGREAGSITAACFLSHFTKDYPWAHLDIAGTAWLSGKNKGATGRPVALLTDYLL